VKGSITEFYKNKRVLVTGGLGFIGRQVVQQLQEGGASVRVVSHRTGDFAKIDCELVTADLTQLADCRRAAHSMECVFHLAAFGWGLGENVKLHSQLFTMNALINTSMLEGAYQAGVERYLYTSSSAVYSGDQSILDDTHPWTGDPHPSEFAFGWAKRMGEVQARVYAEKNGMKIAVVRPSNPYGPGDNFHPTKAHVIPSLIIRAFERQNPFIVWGSGRVERSFLHVNDAARAMLLALEKYAVCDPLNVASEEITNIGQIARLVLDLSGHGKAELVFDSTKPEGHPRKYPAVNKAQEKIGFRAEIPLRDGLQDTIEWYRSTLAKKS
jgi:GDP-L-fucose synthase